jgi:hypothetical protein
MTNPLIHKHNHVQIDATTISVIRHAISGVSDGLSALQHMGLEAVQRGLAGLEHPPYPTTTGGGGNYYRHSPALNHSPHRVA